MEFKTLFADAEFNLVASRSAQAALLKAIKAGQTVVDITQPETPEDPDGNPSGGDNTGTGSDSDSGQTQAVALIAAVALTAAAAVQSPARVVVSMSRNSAE